MKKAVLVVLFCCFVTAIQAQTYSAPGMPLHIHHRPQQLRSTSSTEAKPLMLPRFWHLHDTAMLKAARIFYKTLNHGVKYPATTLKAGIEGTIYVRLTVASDGTISRTDIVRRVVSSGWLGEVPSQVMAGQGNADLDAEVLRAIHKLRFEPKIQGADTVTVASKFVIQ